MTGRLSRRRACGRRAGAVALAASVLTGPVRLALPALAAEDTAVAAVAAPVSVIVTRARTSCFSTAIRVSGYLVPRATAVVMFNLPGFRLTNVVAKEGAVVEAGDVLASLVHVEVKQPPGTDASPGGPQQPPGTPPPAGVAAMPSPPDAVRATAAGLILKSNVVDGQPTSATAGPLFTIAVNNEIEVQADVTSIDALDLAPGQNARLTLEDGREFAGRVRLAPAEIDRTSQTGTSRIAIDGGQGLSVGAFVRVVVDANRSCNVIAVPRAALTQTADGTKIQIVEGDVIRTRVVRVGAVGSTQAELAEGVAAGDLVVANAGTSLRDGDKVKALFADTEDER